MPVTKQQLKVGRASQALGLAMVVGPIMGQFIRRAQGLPAVMPGFETFAWYNPSLLMTHHPIPGIAISTALGLLTIVIATQFIAGRVWARRGLKRLFVCAIVVFVITGTLWFASVWGDSSPAARVFRVGTPVVTLVWVIALLRGISIINQGDTDGA